MNHFKMEDIEPRNKTNYCWLMGKTGMKYS